jgi:heme-degrading monooxygenase HmoA
LSKPAKTPEPPYYAVIFTSTRTDVDEGYGAMSDKMVEMASQQPGFLGVESARDADGLGITVSYWESEEAIANWRAHAEHRIAQATGRAKWYDEFITRVAKVERVNRPFKRA